MKKDPAEVLKSARQNYDNKKYAEALKDYKWFFDNSTKIESAMFGVKLSYCVGEWRKLGDSYEPALSLYRAELQERKQRLLGGESNWDLFMEFSALCDYDGRKNEVIDVFLAIHKNNKNKEFTEKIFRPIKEDLLSSGYVSICNEYLVDPIRDVEHTIEFHKLNQNYDQKGQSNIDDDKFAESMYNKEAIYLLTVLEESNRAEDFEKVKNKLRSYKFSSEIKAFLDGLGNK